MEKRVTGKDVARRAGVTAATVSYVLNGSQKQCVSDATRARVLEAARELGYVPDRTAKSLRRRESGALGVVIEKNLSTPRFSTNVQGMLQEASERGYRITLCRNRMRENGMVDYLNAYYERSIDGVIFVGRDNEGPDAKSAAVIERDRIPFVALDCHLGSGPFGSVDFDYRSGAYEVTTRLLKMSLGRLVYVRPEVQTPQETLREEGVRAACAEAGRVEPVIVQVSIDYRELASFDAHRSAGSVVQGDRDSGYVNMLRLLKRAAVGALRDGDVVVASWSGWSRVLQAIVPVQGAIYADLASDGLSMIGTKLFSQLPNLEAGRTCVSEVLQQITGAASGHHVLVPTCHATEELLS